MKSEAHQMLSDRHIRKGWHLCLGLTVRIWVTRSLPPTHIHTTVKEASKPYVDLLLLFIGKLFNDLNNVDVNTPFTIGNPLLNPLFQSLQLIVCTLCVLFPKGTIRYSTER